MVVFIANTYNQHQSEFCKEMYSLTKGDFRFIETEPQSEERQVMWGNSETAPDIVVKMHVNSEAYAMGINLLETADAVIWGNAPYVLVRDRIEKGKLTFRYSERIFKNGKSPFQFFPRAIKYRLQYPCKQNQYLLCASAYAARDYASIGCYKNRAYKWGYFPRTLYYTEKQLFQKKSIPLLGLL